MLFTFSNQTWPMCLMWLIIGWVSASTPHLTLAQPPTLEQRLKGHLGAHEGRIAVAIKHLTNGETMFVNDAEPMPTASLIKVAVMVTAYRQFDRGTLNRDDPVLLREEDKVPGSGILTKHFSAGTQIPLRDAIRLMITYSDNTATNLVVGKVGLRAVAEEMELLGFPQTKMNALVFRSETSIFPDRSEQFGLGSTTAREMLTLFEKLYKGELASAAATADMLAHLEVGRSPNRLSRLLPAGTTIFQKTGSLPSLRTDAGLIESPSGPFIVVVLTADNQDQRWANDNAAEVLVGRIAGDVYDHFNREHGSAAPHVLSIGASGWLVEALQRTLNAQMSPSPNLNVDGAFGPATHAAVLAFQDGCQLPATGDVDAATWTALGPLITSDVVITDPQDFDAKLPDIRPADSLAGTPFVTCRGWVVGDAETGEIVGGHDIDTPRENASTTKLMTAFLTLREARKDPRLLEQIATISKRADQTPGSTARLHAGERLPVGKVLYGLLLPSGNDASVVLAEHLGDRFDPPESDPESGDPLERFVAEMNRAARELGMSNTRFVNPHGLSAEGHQTTPRDLLRLASQLIHQGTILPYVRTRQHVARVESVTQYVRYEQWTNTNRLLGIEGYLGMKTGTTRAAGACLVSLSERDGRRLIAVVLGSTSSDARYVDTRNLFRWAWQQ